MKNLVIIGASGALGKAFGKQLKTQYPQATVHAFSRNPPRGPQSNDGLRHHAIDYEDEASLSEAATLAAQEAPLDRVIVSTGILHEDLIQPEKSLRSLSAENFRRLFEVNTILPALLIKHFLPQLNRQQTSVFGVLSARVGSISDNRLGGWYAYRSSKAALNMVVKTAAIEVSRRNAKAVVVGLHPGTVDSPLSKPFQANVPAGKLFTADYSASQLLQVMNGLTPAQSGRCFAWDGQEVLP